MLVRWGNACHGKERGHLAQPFHTNRFRKPSGCCDPACPRAQLSQGELGLLLSILAVVATSRLGHQPLHPESHLSAVVDPSAFLKRLRKPCLLPRCKQSLSTHGALPASKEQAELSWEINVVLSPTELVHAAQSGSGFPARGSGFTTPLHGKGDLTSFLETAFG